ncbi:hypothetical protein JCM24511_04861 [Saitozyma sp. JCM 24511]|nr:hypothetical protein JCM24511_04861 [Saitozyma sp. JCM 24511]
MVVIDHTPAFHSLLESRAEPTSSRSKSPSGGRSVGRSRDRGKGKARSVEDEEGEAFLKEAYRIHTHLSELTSTLHSVRLPYLSLSDPPPLSRRTPRTPHAQHGLAAEEDELRRYTGSKYLTDREREEIDLRGKMILRRCRERVRVLEDGEKVRQNRVAPPPHKLLTLLPSLLPTATSSTEPLITAHRASILWTLNSLLAKTSADLTNLQEERSRRRAERGRTLGEGAAKEAARLAASSDLSSRAKSLFGGGTTPNSANGWTDEGISPKSSTTAIIPDGPRIEDQLSQEQLQQFESENNVLLEHMQSQLDSVLSAEKSLLEISALQTELVRHLVQQTEMVEKLYDEAVGSVAEVGKANEQLKKAKQRGSEARFFLLVFLIGASMALLFLNWYA